MQVSALLNSFNGNIQNKNDLKVYPKIDKKKSNDATNTDFAGLNHDYPQENIHPNHKYIQINSPENGLTDTCKGRQYPILTDITNDTNNIYFPKGTSSLRGIIIDSSKERSYSNCYDGNTLSCSSSLVNARKYQYSTNPSSGKRFTINFKKNKNDDADSLNINNENLIPRTNHVKENAQPSTPDSQNKDNPEISDMNSKMMFKSNCDLNDLNGNILEKLMKFKAKLQDIESDFESILRISEKIQEKYLTINLLAKGNEFTKISYRSNKFIQRLIYYHERLEGICWHDPKNKFPKPNQIVLLKDIVNIHVHVDSTIQFHKRLLNLRIDDSLFISIETKDRCLDILAPNLHTKMIWVKTLNMLVLLRKNNQIENEKSLTNITSTENPEIIAVPKILKPNINSNELNSTQKQFNKHIIDLKNEIEAIKEGCMAYHQQLRKAYLENTESMLKKQKNLYISLEKSFSELNHQHQIVIKHRSGFQKDLCQVKRELENISCKNKELTNEIKVLRDEKSAMFNMIKDFHGKLFSYIEYINALEFNVETTGKNELKIKPINTAISTLTSLLTTISSPTAFNSIVSKTSLENGLIGIEFDINTLNKEVKMNFENIILKINEINKKFIKIREELKQKNQSKELSKIDNESFNKKYNELQNNYNETIKEKEKIYNQLQNSNLNLKHNQNENNQLKSQIKTLVSENLKLKNQLYIQERNIQIQMMYCQKVKDEVDNQLDQLKKEAIQSEMKKLSIVEDKYANHINRYEKKILEKEVKLKELEVLVNFHEQTSQESRQNVVKGEYEIDRLANLKEKLSRIIIELEEKLRSKKDEIQPLSLTINEQNTNLLFQLNPLNNALSSFSDHSKCLFLDQGYQYQEGTPKLESIFQISEKNGIKFEIDTEELMKQKNHDPEFQKNSFTFTKTQQNNNLIDQISSHYSRDSWRSILDENSKLKALNKILESKLSCCLHFLYLINLIIFYEETSCLVHSFTPEINASILQAGIKKIKQAFKGFSGDDQFFNNLINNILENIPNIILDTRIMELCKAYINKYSKVGTVTKRRHGSEYVDYPDIENISAINHQNITKNSGFLTTNQDYKSTEAIDNSISFRNSTNFDISKLNDFRILEHKNLKEVHRLSNVQIIKFLDQ